MTESRSGYFKAQDVAQIKQSVRKDGNWAFFKRHMKKLSATKNKKITVCEIGCGTGDIVILSEKYLQDFIECYHAFEGSSEMMFYIKREKLTFTKPHLQDVDKLKTFPNCDCFVSKHSFHHIKNKQEVLQKMHEALTKNGQIIIVDKFPSFGYFSVVIEKIWHILKIKPVLGTHYYTSINDFKKLAKRIGFDIVLEKSKQGKKIKNFFVLRSFLVLQKK